MSDTAPDTAIPRPRRRWRTEIRDLLVIVALAIGCNSLVAKHFYIPSESMMPGLQVGDHLIVSKYPYGWSYVSPSFGLLPFVGGRILGALPRRGDIVTLTPPGAARRHEDLIKRVVGLPGDVVQLRRGRLWLNGRPVATRDAGFRSIPVDGRFRCDAADPAPDRAFPGFAGARVTDAAGRSRCRVRVRRETLPGGRSYDTLDFGDYPQDHIAPYRVPPGHVFLLGDNRDNSADSRIAAAAGGLGGAVPVEHLGGRAEFLTFSLNGNAGVDPRSWPSGFRHERFGRSLR